MSVAIGAWWVKTRNNINDRCKINDKCSKVESDGDLDGWRDVELPRRSGCTT